MGFLNKLDGWVRNSTHRILGFLEDRLAPFTLIAFVSVLTLSVLFWDSWIGEKESVGMAIRNLLLVLAAIAALPLAIWRSKVAERQADTAQRSLLNERYQKGAEMLGSEILSVRLGGIYALQHLASEHSEQYHVQIMRLLCTFVRNPTKDSEENAKKIKQSESETRSPPSDTQVKPTMPRSDIQAIMEAIGSRSEAQIEIEEQEDYRLDLRLSNLQYLHLHLGEANLSRVLLVGADLTGACLSRVKLSHALMFNADLTYADLGGANLSEANLSDAKLAHVFMFRAVLSDAQLTGCKGLTQKKLDLAIADKDKPPNLFEAFDAQTGAPLEWRGRPFDDK